VNWFGQRRWIVRAALASLWRARGSVAASVLTVTIALCLSGLAGLLQTQVRLLQDHWHDKVEISVYLCTRDSTATQCLGATSAPRIAELRELITDTPGVTRVYFESPQEAFSEFQRRFAGTEIARSVGPDALPGSFRVKLATDAPRAEIVEAWGTLTGVEIAQDQRRMLNGFFAVVGRVRLGSLLFAGAQSLAASAMIAHLLRTSLRHRRREIEIMSLVGAPPRLLRGPFVLESVLVCVAAGALSTGVLLAGVSALGPMVNDSGMLLARTIDQRDVLRVASILGAVSILGGWALSRWTLRRSLR
jgi:cell division transport system permease protein